MADIAKMIEEIKSMTVVELNDLVKAIEEEFGVSAAAPVAVAAVAAAAPADFNTTLTSLGPCSSAAATAATATGAAALTPNSSSIAFTNSFNSNTLISLTALINSSTLNFAISFFLLKLNFKN